MRSLRVRYQSFLIVPHLARPSRHIKAWATSQTGGRTATLQPQRSRERHPLLCGVLRRQCWSRRESSAARRSNGTVPHAPDARYSGRAAAVRSDARAHQGHERPRHVDVGHLFAVTDRAWCTQKDTLRSNTATASNLGADVNASFVITSSGPSQEKSRRSTPESRGARTASGMPAWRHITRGTV
jgi:hypothetical protein